MKREVKKAIDEVYKALLKELDNKNIGAVDLSSFELRLRYKKQGSHGAGALALGGPGGGGDDHDCVRCNKNGCFDC